MAHSIRRLRISFSVVSSQTRAYAFYGVRSKTTARRVLFLKAAHDGRVVPVSGPEVRELAVIMAPESRPLGSRYTERVGYIKNGSDSSAYY